MRSMAAILCVIAGVVTNAMSAKPASGERAQEGSRAATTQQPPPGGMVIPPGYTSLNIRGIDSKVGKFVKAGGPSIFYQIGAMRPSIVNVPERPQLFENTSSFKVAWNRTIPFRGATVRIYMITGGELRVDTGSANFVGTNVQNQEDVADVLLMALSYDPDVRRRELGIKNPPAQKK